MKHHSCRSAHNGRSKRKNVQYQPFSSSHPKRAPVAYFYRSNSFAQRGKYPSRCVQSNNKTKTKKSGMKGAPIESVAIHSSNKKIATKCFNRSFVEIESIAF